MIDNIQIKFVFRQPESFGEARRITINEGGKDYRGFVLVLPCGHMAVVDKRWRITDLDTSTPTVHPSLDCRAGDIECWHGWLEKGVLRKI